MRDAAARHRTAFAVLMLFATVALLLVANTVVQSRSEPGHHERKVVVLTGAYAFHFDTLADMVATSATGGIVKFCGSPVRA